MRGIPIVDSEQMRALDRAAIEADGIPSLTLMERAGYGVFQRIAEWFAPLSGKRVAVLTGKGNNGGDGMVVARYLHEAGAQAHLWLACAPDEFRGDAATQWRMVQAYGIPALPLPDAPDPALFRDEDLLVDALLGIGAQGNLSPRLCAVIDAVNRAGRPIVAVDIPSGIDADTGVALGAAVWATYTVTMALPKAGFFQNDGAHCVGRWAIAPIGIPPRRLEATPCVARLMTEQETLAQTPCMPLDAHKGHRGHVLVVGGSLGMAGAPALAAISALRVGAGLATVATPTRIQPQVASFYPEVMTLPLPDDDTGALTLKGAQWLAERLGRFSVLALGPGLGAHETVGKAMLELLEAWRVQERPLVIDADGLNWLARLGADTPLPTRTILTPHPGEAARLLQIETHQVQQDRYSSAELLRERYRALCVLKGAYTVIADEEGLWLAPFAEPSLATGGSGDVLTGAIAGLLAQGLEPLPAAQLGVYLHGQAGARLACGGRPAYTADELSRALRV
ncbi:MAG: bifunctional NAD(P)H-hydrate repair enzyme Nnr [Fimbriimonadales bacterium]|nr:MAG: bifunctional NAD(P)H-hydrate repair enzyme Nnr [Fimbriimonadales bacterium]